MTLKQTVGRKVGLVGAVLALTLCLAAFVVADGWSRPMPSIPVGGSCTMIAGSCSFNVSSTAASAVVCGHKTPLGTIGIVSVTARTDTSLTVGSLNVLDVSEVSCVVA